jgi:alpha-mannosidase
MKTKQASLPHRIKLLISFMSILSFSCFSAQRAQAWPGQNPPAAQQNAPQPRTLWLIPHTHWEGAVFKTREEYLAEGLPHILTALALLRAHPEYRYVLDQVAYVRPFLERYPEQAAAFRQYVAEGRLQIACGNDVMLDVNMPSGESWVRQVLYGKGYYRDALGVDVTVGWGLDTFGHHAQMPQLLKLAGYQSYWFQRGVPSIDTPSEFLWQGLDGTRIPAMWLALSYGLFTPAPKDRYEFARYAEGVWDGLGQYSRWPDRVALVGTDVSEAEEAVPGLVKEFNETSGAPFELRFGVPTDFAAAVAKRSEHPVVSGDFNPIFQGVYSSRIELKQWVRRLEDVLTNAEKLTALASAVGVASNWVDSTRAWEPVLFNQAHDLMSGTMVDKVYNDTIRGYEFSQDLGNAQIDAELNDVAARMDTRVNGVPIVVFNTLGWSRTDVAEIEVGSIGPNIHSLSLRDPSGKDVPLQFLETLRYDDGSLKDVKLAFLARDVPAFGYALYQLVPSEADPSGSEVKNERSANANTQRQDAGSIENEFYRVSFDLWTGAMKELYVKPEHWDVLGGRPGNIVAREPDGGDFWELYGSLNGGRFTAMTRKQGLPASDRANFSNEQVGGSGATSAGPVFSQFTLSHTFGDGSFATTVRVYPGMLRIDFRTQLLNNNKFVRYRVLFPTSIMQGKRFDEIPFGTIERPLEQEFPAQYWMDYGDGAKGLALLNRGLPGNNVASGSLILSLLRSTQITNYPFFGGYEPGVSSDLGLELGVERTFDYALVPHAGHWCDAGVYRAGWEFNHPLIARKVATHAGSLPRRWGLVEISAPDVVASALMPGRDGAVMLRIYEASGKPSSGVAIKLRVPLSSASETNLLGDAGKPLAIAENTVHVDLRAFEIKTLKLNLHASEMGR